MKAITSISHKLEAGTDNFTITFNFSANDYIENEQVSVKFIMEDENEPKKTESDEIKWKEGKNITKKTVEKKQRNKKTGKTRTVTKEVDAESFFNFFKSLEANEDAEAPEDEDEVRRERN